MAVRRKLTFLAWLRFVLFHAAFDLVGPGEYPVDIVLVPAVAKPVFSIDNLVLCR